jgi:hypothetical protein
MPAFSGALAMEHVADRIRRTISPALLGDELDKHGDQLRVTVPIRRVGPADVAALAVHVMTNTAFTGTIYDIDGGQQLARGV